MLQGQDGCRNEDRHLPAFGDHFESRPDRDLRLAESYITAYKPVHRRGLFQVSFYICSGFNLVGSIFIDKGSFQLRLQIAVGSKCKALCRLAFRVKSDQVLGNVFDPVLGLVFQLIPGIGTKTVHHRCRSLFADVFGDPVERMDAHIKQVVILIDQPDRFLLPAVVDDLLEPVEPSHPMIDVGDISRPALGRKVL